MWKSLKQLLASKKALMSFISAAVWLIGKAGFDIETEVLAGMVTPLWVFILGQGISDLGKGKAEVEKDGKTSLEGALLQMSSSLQQNTSASEYVNPFDEVDPDTVDPGADEASGD